MPEPTERDYEITDRLLCCCWNDDEDGARHAARCPSVNPRAVERAGRILASALATAREEGRRDAMEEARNAMCQYCKLGWPIVKGTHRTKQNVAMSCEATDIRALIGGDK